MSVPLVSILQISFSTSFCLFCFKINREEPNANPSNILILIIFLQKHSTLYFSFLPLYATSGIIQAYPAVKFLHHQGLSKYYISCLLLLHVSFKNIVFSLGITQFTLLYLSSCTVFLFHTLQNE